MCKILFAAVILILIQILTVDSVFHVNGCMQLFDVMHDIVFFVVILLEQ